MDRSVVERVPVALRRVGWGALKSDLDSSDSYDCCSSVESKTTIRRLVQDYLPSQGIYPLALSLEPYIERESQPAPASHRRNSGLTQHY